MKNDLQVISKCGILLQSTWTSYSFWLAVIHVLVPTPALRVRFDHYFLPLPLLSGAELQLIFVRTCRPFPPLHKGHSAANNPYCKANALENSIWWPWSLHPWPRDKTSSHFTENTTVNVYWEDNPKWFFFLVFMRITYKCTLLPFAIDLGNFKTYSWRRIRKSVITLLFPVDF